MADGRDEAGLAEIRAELDRAEAELARLRGSLSWRVTAPLRLAMRAALLARNPVLSWRRLRERAVRSMRARGVRGVSGAASVALRKLRGARGVAVPAAAGVYGAGVRRAPGELFGRRVLIVAELGLAQCAKYFVWQKRDHFAALGAECRVVAWQDGRTARRELQLCSLVIFYRTPGTPELLAMMEEARRLGLAPVWEVDDIIFDAAVLAENRNLDLLEPGLKRELLGTVESYRRSLMAADAVIGSVPRIVEAMQAVRDVPSYVVQVGLDAETLRVAAEVRAARALGRGDGEVRIVYGSVSKAHNADFGQAAGALARVLRAHPQARLWAIGALELPAELADVAAQVVRLPGVPYADYLRLAGGADIAIAPLLPLEFNEGKSTTKFLEAGILGMPAICSGRGTFRAVIRHGETGFIADREDEWVAALEALVHDAGLRERVGQAALDYVLTQYDPMRIAREQVAPVLENVALRRDGVLRVLAVNLFYAPESFGGATVVAEQMARRLNAVDGVEVVVFAGGPASLGEAAGLRRYEVDGVAVIAALRAAGAIDDRSWRDPRMRELFRDVLRAVQPDVVHFHSVQGISASVIEAARAEGIPYVVTLHDAWFLCERQFMIRENGRACLQHRIDWSVCAGCVPDLGASMARAGWLRSLLMDAALLLTPSTYFRDLHVANGFPAERVRVNRNGVAVPGALVARGRRERLRLGFVGGAGPTKGLNVVRAALEGSRFANFELVLVDNTLALGFSGLDVAGWKLAREVLVVPAYRQNELDAFFGGIDVLLFPTQWRESFGLTVREALLRDVWVIASDAGGVVEDIVDGVNGTVIPLTDDPAPLRAAIEALLVAPERLEGFVNPHKAGIASHEDQARELLGFLKAVAAS